MIRKWIAPIVASLALAACASSPEPERELVVALGPDGELMFVPGEGADDEEAAMVAVLNQLMADIDEEDAAPEALDENEIWREMDGGHVLHIQSGAICAASMAGVAREREVIYAPDGSDVGCNYADAARSQSYVTMYVYQRPHDVLAEWDEAMMGLTTRQPAAEEVRFGMPSPSFASTTLAYEGVDGTPVRSSLLLGEANGWFMKLRITCPAGECERVEQMAAIGLIGQMDRVRMGERAPDLERAAPT